jgi:hypothetical protein
MPTEWSSYQPRYFAQLQRASGKGEAGKPPKIYVAVGQLKAEWPLPTTDTDALAMLPETLKEQIDARDLMGQKNKAKLDKAQQEKLEELQAAMQENMGYSTSEENQPLAILFAAKVDEDSRKLAIKTAYERAVKQAETLAAVTGHKLGELVSLRCEDAPSVALDEYSSPYAQMQNAYAGARMAMASSQGEAAVSPSPGGLAINVKVDVEFAIAK